MRRTLVINLALAALTVAVYWQTVHYDFVYYDDPPYVTENARVRAGLTAAGARWAFTSADNGNWHPLTTLSNMLACELFGVDPAGHHLLNVVLHVAATLVLFAMLHAATGGTWPSAFVAALFAVHPGHVESVAWVSSRKDVLSALFGLAAIWAYVAWARRGGKGGTARYLLALGLFAASLMSKPMFVTLPVLLLLLDYWPLGRLAGAAAGPLPARRTLARLVTEKLPFFALSVVGSVVTIAVQHVEVVRGATVPLHLRLGNALVSYAGYLGKLVWPQSLAVLYPHPALPGGTPLAPWQITRAVLVLTAITTLSVVARRRGYPLVGWLWYAIMLVPVSGVVLVGEQAMADRYTYTPFVGLFIIVAWGAADLLARRQRALSLLAGGVALALILAAAFGAWRQTHYWRNSTTLFEHSLAVAPEPAVMHNNLAIAYQLDGELEAAARHYRDAVRVDPAYAPALTNLAALLRRQGQVDQAAALYRRALAVNPRYAPAHNDLGDILKDAGQTEEALAHFQQALEIDPRLASARLQLGAALETAGYADEALEHYRIGVEVAPHWATAQLTLAEALRARHQDDEAMEHYRRAISLDPESARAHGALAVLLDARDQVAEAIEHYRAALERDPDNADLRGNLGYALYSRGDLIGAVREYERALATDPANAKVHNNFVIVLLRQGRGEEAIAHGRAALAARPDYAKAHNNLASALLIGGDIDGAIHHYREAVRLEPAYAEARKNLARAEEARKR
jgi:tetratricopeptide (TPR) repeat protein